SLRPVLLAAIERLAREAGASSIHLLFLDGAEQRAARDAGWMLRGTVQFHWTNREPEPYADFDDFLAGMQHDKRKKIRQERRKVAAAGVEFAHRSGRAISTDDWDFFYRCYTRTYRAHRSTPYLTRDFFARIAASQPEHWLLFIASRGGQRIAASLIGIDPERRHAFGRYWGATAALDCLHFEACYYQPLTWCIANRYRRFEGGAQGEHKMARGLLPVAAASAHWLAHPRFAQAVAEYLQREGEAVAGYIDELDERVPFKTAPAK
ncbi:MAG TPA: peptidogalycan biosysnthesis protein, partial [Burkholderiaceae bacterium]|nr:peptidogalycan biosysnthesis protein [Burkholderiaceae bacterium]